MSPLTLDKSLQFDAAPDNQISCSVDGSSVEIQQKRVRRTLSCPDERKKSKLQRNLLFWLYFCLQNESKPPIILNNLVFDMNVTVCLLSWWRGTPAKKFLVFRSNLYMHQRQMWNVVSENTMAWLGYMKGGNEFHSPDRKTSDLPLSPDRNGGTIM